MPHNPHGMTSHILTNPESLHRQWNPWTGDTVLWPSPPLKYQVGQQYSVRAFTSYVFAVSRPLPSPILVCDRIHGTLACDACGYPFNGFCGHSKATTNERVFRTYHILVYDVWISRTSHVLDTYQSRSAQEIYITSSSHAPRIQSNIHHISHTRCPRLSRLLYSNILTNSINLECELVGMILTGAYLALPHQVSYTAMHAVHPLPPRRHA